MPVTPPHPLLGNAGRKEAAARRREADAARLRLEAARLRAEYAIEVEAKERETKRRSAP